MAIDRDLLDMHPDLEGSSSTTLSHKRDKKQMTPLPDDFTPGNYDVVCAKGKAVHQHVGKLKLAKISSSNDGHPYPLNAPANHWSSLSTGNRRFRVICRMHLEKYSAATTKQEKSRIVSAIFDTVQRSTDRGGFVKLDPLTGKWFEVSTHHAREKIGQTLRDALHTKYSSSTKAKKLRRQSEKAKARSMSMSSQEELPMPTTLSSFAASQGLAPTTTLNNVGPLLRPQAQEQPRQSSSSLRRSTSSCLLDIFFDDKHYQTLKELNDSELNPQLAAQLSQPTPNCYRGKAA